MKKQLPIYFGIILLSMFFTNAFASNNHDIEVENDDGVTIYYKWNENKTELTVSHRGDSPESYSNEYSGRVVIPETVLYGGTSYRVTSIGYNAFMYCEYLTSIKLPNSIKTIGHNAFHGCSMLTSIVIPNSVISIGFSAFRICTNLSSITFPNSAVSYGTGALDDTAWYKNQPNGLVYAGKILYKYKGTMPENTSIETSEELLGIASKAFENCVGLTSIILPQTLVYIGSSSFANCANLTSIIIPNSVNDIGNAAFEGCSKLTSFTIPEGVTRISSNLFSDCSSLTSVIIPSTITSIEEYAFQNCVGLTSMIVPNSVTNIGNGAFYNCKGLQFVIIGDGVTSLPDFLFGEISLRTLTLGTSIIKISKYIFKKSTSSTSTYYPSKTIWLTSVLPSGYQYAEGVNNYISFNTSNNIRNITVYPLLNKMFEVDGVKYVPLSLTDNTCEAIDCAYDESAEKIHIEKSIMYNGVSMIVKKIKPNAFILNTFIKDVELSFDGDIEYRAFYRCGNISKLTVNTKGDIGESAFEEIKSELSASINNQGSIGTKAFYNSTGLKTLLIGSNVSNIGSSAFRICNNLEVVDLQNHGSIDDNAFQGCRAITKITLGDNITSIGQFAFRYCSSIQSIVIPNTVTKIGICAFRDCSQLVSVKISNNIKIINTYTFANCSMLSDLQIGTNINTIDAFAFSDCTSLKNIVIPKSVTSIGASSFYNNTSLAKVFLGKGIETISNNAFANCPSLEELYCYAKNVPNTEENVFEGSNIENVLLYVPTTSYSSYEAVEPWKNFKNILKINIPTYTLIYIVDDKEYKTYTLEEDELITPEPAPIREGYTFSGWSEIPAIMPAHDVTVTGSFTINMYKLIYKVDGVVYKEYEIEYGAVINTESEPTKDTYLFSGWSEIPATMPDHDVIVTGTFERHFDVGHVVKVVNFIMNSNATTEEFALYDVNNDTELNIGDVILIVKNILSQSNSGANTVNRRASSIADFAQYTAAQFELKVDKNASIKDIRLVGSMIQSHQLMYEQKDDNTYAVVVYSLSNQLMKPENGCIVEVEADGGDATMQNILVATQSGETHYYQSNGTITGIYQLKNDSNSAVIFDLKGNRLSGKSLEKGIYIVNGKKVIVK